MMKRVVVTGLGCITPLGKQPSDLWTGLLSGRSVAKQVESFDTSAMDRHVGCEIRESLSPGRGGDLYNGSEGRATRLALHAALQALRDSHVPRSMYEHLSVCVGTTMSEAFNGVNSRKEFVLVDKHRPSTMSYRSVRMNCLAWEVAQEVGARGQCLTVPTACAAGNYAIGIGYELVSSGKSPMVLAGGADAFSRIAYVGFARLMAMSPDVCRPFDRNRQGLLVGEGSAFLLLEDEVRARARGAHIYAEILGCGLSCDGFHITAPHPKGLGAALAIRRVLAQGKIALDRVSYISAHGTGTLANDRVETIAIKRVFGKRAYSIPVSSIKSILGHSMGAASAIEALVSCVVLERKVLPPTWNYREPDPACDLDYVPNEPRPVNRVQVILSNSFAFGGNNACLALASYRSLHA